MPFLQISTIEIAICAQLESFEKAWNSPNQFVWAMLHETKQHLGCVHLVNINDFLPLIYLEIFVCLL